MDESAVVLQVVDQLHTLVGQRGGHLNDVIDQVEQVDLGGGDLQVGGLHVLVGKNLVDLHSMRTNCQNCCSATQTSSSQNKKDSRE